MFRRKTQREKRFLPYGSATVDAPVWVVLQLPFQRDEGPKYRALGGHAAPSKFVSRASLFVLPAKAFTTRPGQRRKPPRQGSEAGRPPPAATAQTRSGLGRGNPRERLPPPPAQARPGRAGAPVPPGEPNGAPAPRRARPHPHGQFNALSRRPSPPPSGPTGHRRPPRSAAPAAQGQRAASPPRRCPGSPPPPPRRSAPSWCRTAPALGNTPRRERRC